MGAGTSKAMMLALLALAGCAAPGRVPLDRAASLDERVRAVLYDPSVAGTRWGLLVVDEAGREVVAIAPDDRFLPASNTKLVTIAALHAEPGLMATPIEGTAVAIEPAVGASDVVLVGSGDPLLRDTADCIANCLATLADAVAARTKAVRGVIGDDRAYPDERWGQGWSWDDLQGRYGTAVSALTLNDNVTSVTVTAGAVPLVVSEDGWFAIDNRVAAGTTTALDVERLPGSRTVRVFGTIAADAPVQTIRLGVDDPAEWAAYRFARLLRARGVTVAEAAKGRHRAPGDPRPAVTGVVARLDPPPYAEAVRETMKVSQNLYAEMLLRRVAARRGDRGTADGFAAIDAMFAQAGVARAEWDLFDGSGMSVYNRLSPRAVVGLLRWSQAQPWGADYRDTMPVGGVDGTLTNRFKDTPLAGRVFAKTGSLKGTAALSGFLTTASGRTLTFSSFANDRPSGGGATTLAAERALNLIAAEY
ncbi:D-alanyl-D-alanine carboxypeptidase/D-alanyl-D-alanine-endopeptidase [Sphingomonas sp. S1-29]|uniref:D-alanyl-D-alanine carboxypeptidase/D-alanyl-D-alanine endopeptidase n=1 Tax=Sphingomonas sp. S1-29 TaxID=2991074 RepID=UPI0022406530|nr:D-alanyl-D-alanine carboxypeptidase/D-alanyl-D-alanine-endopeptidase [Sphingomonas sp. S1-29]UZK68267.1 D-alanyl-D-alanine carboxypeptidase/D-alanyl-D-alanine-endopeptidase [Sphingomonas sp. S1-29]